MNILDEINAQLKELTAKVESLEKKLDRKHSKQEVASDGYATAAKLCTIYSISRTTLNDWIKRIENSGEKLEVQQLTPTSIRRFKIADFDKAFKALMNQNKEAA